MIVWRMETRGGEGVFQECSGHEALGRHKGDKYPNPWQAGFTGNLGERIFGCPSKEDFRFWFPRECRKMLAGTGVGVAVYRAKRVERMAGRQVVFCPVDSERLHWFELKGR